MRNLLNSNSIKNHTIQFFYLSWFIFILLQKLHEKHAHLLKMQSLIGQNEEDRIMHLANQVNNFIIKTIVFSQSAKEVIDLKLKWFKIMTNPRIKAYSTESFATHYEKTITARALSQKKRRAFLLQTHKESMTIDEASRISYEVGAAHRALNCSAQAMMGYHLLKTQGIASLLLGVFDIDHFYLGLKNRHNKIFAIMDPWSGQLFLLNSKTAQALSMNAYRFFDPRKQVYEPVEFNENAVMKANLIRL